MKSRLVMFTAICLAAAALGAAAGRLIGLAPVSPPVVHATLAPNLASYLGTFEPGAPPDYAPVAGFAKVAGRQPNLVGYYSGWAQPFNMAFAQMIRKHGVIPFVQIDPTDASIAAIAAGTYDEYLHTYADRVRGPLVATYSVFDYAVGRWYPKASFLAHEDTEAVDQTSRWDGMGADGFQAVAPLKRLSLLADQPTTFAFDPGTFYRVDCGWVINDVTQSAFSGAHSDIRKAPVAQLAAATAGAGASA